MDNTGLILKFTNKIDELLRRYSITEHENAVCMDTSRDDSDVRLNFIVDKKYVLRINNGGGIDEDRIARMQRLAERYNSVNVKCPRFIKSVDGRYSFLCDGYLVYLQEYLDYPLASEIAESKTIRKQVIEHLGVFASKFTGVDLWETNSMWSLIDLAPLDVDIDEKQENFNELYDKLVEIGEIALAKEAAAFNEANRAAIKRIYKKLPRCVYQGDLNPTNILTDRGEFVGLIDFNMAGTEVNVNNFINETDSLDDELFRTLPPQKVLTAAIAEQDGLMSLILKNYTLNNDEISVLENYRNICLISQYPTVSAFIDCLDDMRYRPRIIELIKLIINR